jgi:hypothetical protein
MGMRKSVLLMALVAVAMLLATLYGCEQTSTGSNEGLSETEERKLNQRIEELEKEIESEDKADPKESADQSKENSKAEQSEQQAEDDVWTAAEGYYQAVSSEDWAFTYNALDSETRSLYTKDEWFARNQWFADNGSVTYDVLSVDVDTSSPKPIADVSVGLTYGDGTTSTRLTYFVYENGSWKHRFGEEENDLFMPDASYEEFVAAQGGTASPSASGEQEPEPQEPEPQGPTFSDGTYQVGTDIQPGTYRTRESSLGCYYARLGGFSGELNDILANANTDAPAVVTIKPTDAGFESQGCGTWTKDLSAITESKTSFDDGIYIVGTDIEPGTYRSSGSSGCYYARLRNFSADLNSIIANGNTDAPTVVTIAPTDAGFESQNCGTWTKLE